MSLDTLKSRIENLVREINRAEIAYRRGEAIMTDSAFDALWDELVLLEKAHPHLVHSNSPTKSIGSDTLSEGFPEVRHKHVVGSLDKTKNASEFNRWVSNNGLTPQVELVATPKLDGLSLVVHYSDGELVQAVKRGDGLYGEVVTDNARTIRNLPKQIKAKGEIIVRGEVVVHKDDLVQYNEKNFTTYGVPRAFASGSLNLLSSKECATRPLRFYAFEVMGSHDKYTEQLVQLSELGFESFPKSATFTADLFPSMVSHWENARELFPYDVDGMVIRVNDSELYRALGSSTRNPKGAVAFKFGSANRLTQLESVEWQVSRTGRINPVGILRPVIIGGVMIERVTLKTSKQVQEWNLHLGDDVIVERSNDVIPNVAQVLAQFRKSDAQPVVIPETCPSCGGGVEWDANNVHIYCTNDGCISRKVGEIVHWCQSIGMDGISDSLVAKMVEHAGIRHFIDMYYFYPTSLLGVDGVGDGLVTMIAEQVAKSKNASPVKVFASLNIPSVGESTAEKLLDAFGSISNVFNQSESSITAIKGFGKALAKKLSDWYTDDNKELLDELRQLGFAIDSTLDNTKPEGVLSGITFCFSGKFEQTKSYYERMVEERGGEHGGISKNTTYLVVSDKNTGSNKMQKAIQYGINILDEDEFFALIARADQQG